MVDADPDFHAPSTPDDIDLATTVVPPPASTAPARRRLPIASISIALVAVLGGSVLFLSGYSLGVRRATDPGTPASVAGEFQPFWDTYHTITERYAGGDYERDALVQGAIRGMIASLGDPYSAYLTSEEYRQSLQGISGQFEGIGAEIASEAPDGTQGCTPLGAACRLVITQPIDGSPAQDAGVHAGDVVIAVDGAPVDGLTIDAARDRLRGLKGTVVTLQIQRSPSASIQFVITRDVIQNPEVGSKVLGGGQVGYISLAGFSDAAADDVVTAVKTHLAAGRTKLILDLRGDPGGFVTAARKVASQFIASGVIFWEQDAQGNQVPTNALGGGVATDPNVQVIVLINGGSASASEIVAGALQDSQRATLVGQTSYGKGTVQQWQELTGQGGAFKLTIARWLTPHKRSINKVGLVPDVPVTLPNPVPQGTDPDLDKALEILGVPATGSVLQAAA